MRPFPKYAGTGLPFSGLGMNVHFCQVPVADCEAIGVRWYRMDHSGFTLTPELVDQKIDAYGGQRILWVLDRFLPTPLADALLIRSRFIAKGFKPPKFEFWNEFIQLTPPHDEGVAEFYRDSYNAFRAQLPEDCMLFGCVDEPAFVLQLYEVGFRADAYTVHNYSISPSYTPGVTEWLSKSLSAPVFVSEGNGGSGSGPWSKSTVKTYFKAMLQEMGNRPWGYYAGPAPVWDAVSNAKGMWLFDTRDANAIEYYRDRTPTIIELADELGYQLPG